MAQVIVNSTEQRQFANGLRQLRKEITDLKGKTESEFRTLNDSWKDKKYSQFEKTFVESSPQVDIFVKCLENYADFLNKKASLAERYLGR